MALFKEISLKVRYFLGSLFYLSYAPKSFLYSYKRDWLERQARPPETVEAVEKPGKLLRAEPIVRGARFYFEQAELELHFLTSDLVRVEWFPGIPPIPYAVSRQDWPEVETILDETGDRWTVSSKDTALKVVVGVDGSLTFCDSAGQILREEIPPQRRGEAWMHQARLREEEHIYGLGERAAPLNLRAAKAENQQSKTYRMWNFDAAGM